MSGHYTLDILGWTLSDGSEPEAWPSWCTGYHDIPCIWYFLKFGPKKSTKLLGQLSKDKHFGDSTFLFLETASHRFSCIPNISEFYEPHNTRMVLLVKPGHPIPIHPSGPSINLRQVQPPSNAKKSRGAVSSSWRIPKEPGWNSWHFQAFVDDMTRILRSPGLRSMGIFPLPSSCHRPATTNVVQSPKAAPTRSASDVPISP
jgi:hypothetical protein